MEEFYNQFMLDFNQAETDLEKEIKGVPEDIASVRISPGTSPELIIPHPVLGKMTKIDWLYSTPFHSMRHTEQIREIKSKLANKI